MMLPPRLNFADRIELGERGWEYRGECMMEPFDYYPCAEDDCMRLKERMWVCSKCECDCIGVKPRYCPNCGARVTPKNSETTPKVVS